MNVVLSLMRRDQSTAQKIPFWTYYICLFVVIVWCAAPYLDKFFGGIFLVVAK